VEWRVAELGGHFPVVDFLSLEVIRVHPCPKKFGVCRGGFETRPYGARSQIDKALFLTLGTFLFVFTHQVHKFMLAHNESHSSDWVSP
jgi:hypothetical protein